MVMKDQYTAAFQEEASELLGELEGTLLELEERPDAADLVARAFRALHTIKGSGAMFGFDDVASFTHEVETVFEQVRDGKMRATPQLIGLTLEAKDMIRALFQGEADEGERQRVTVAFRRMAVGEEAPSGPVDVPVVAAPEPVLSVEPSGPEVTYRIQFRPERGLPETAAAGIVDELKKLGRCGVVFHGAENGPDESACVPWDAILTTDQGENPIRDAFLFVDARAAVRIDRIDNGWSQGEEPDYKRLGEILVDRGDLTTEQVLAAVAEQKRIGDVLEEKGLVAPSAVKAAALEQKVVRDLRSKREAGPAEAGATIRVPADKLDQLVNLVGELVIAQARLTQTTGRKRTEAELQDADAGRKRDGVLRAIAEDIARLSADLRDQTLNIRMVPIGTTFGRFKRLVRDVANELGKEIDLVTEGAETELDKTVIERLGDPLVHLIRNSCDHGLEAPATRHAAGKPLRGTVRLSAYHAGASVVVEINDDGAGLNSERIRAKALERGLLSPDARLSDKELFGLILLPGFSTAEKVSSLSGRGVGMDVVKRSIDALRGSLEIESTLGVGTAIRIKLPLTLAIIEGLLVGVGDQSYVLPLSLVEECVELTRRDVENAHGSRLATVRGELVPYLRLRDCFDVSGELPEIEQIVVARVEGFRFGFVVDSVVGQHQTVIKTLGRMYRDVEGLSGATILGDGSVALILDCPALLGAAGGRGAKD